MTSEQLYTMHPILPNYAVTAGEARRVDCDFISAIHVTQVLRHVEQ